MAEINLDDLLKAKKAQEGAASAETGKEMVTVEQVTAAVETISPEERAQIVKIKDELDLTDSTAVLSYGAPAQKRSAEFSNNVLSQVRTKDSGQVGELLQGLVAQVKGYNPEGGSSGGSFLKKIPIVGSLVEKAEDV